MFDSTADGTENCLVYKQVLLSKAYSASEYKQSYILKKKECVSIQRLWHKQSFSVSSSILG